MNEILETSVRGSTAVIVIAIGGYLRMDLCSSVGNGDGALAATFERC